MKRFGRGIFVAMMMALLMMPGLASTVSASAESKHICERAYDAGAGAVIDGYTVVWNTGGSGSQIVLGYWYDYLDGGSGHDILCSWGDGNKLYGGSGHDQLFAFYGSGNKLFGQSGNDLLVASTYNSFDGGSGTNEIITF